MIRMPAQAIDSNFSNQVNFLNQKSFFQSAQPINFANLIDRTKALFRVRGITALPAKRTDAVASWGHKNMETLWVFHSLMVALAVHGTEFLKILWKTVLPACHHVAIADKIQNEL